MTGSANIHCIDCIPHGNQFFFLMFQAGGVQRVLDTLQLGLCS